MQVHDDINTANVQGSYTSATAGASSGAESGSGQRPRKQIWWWNYQLTTFAERRRFDIRRRHLSEELEKVLWCREAFIGADGSIVKQGDDVYLLEAPFQDRVMKIDYFHGYHFGVPCALVWNDDEDDHSLAMNMVQLASWGNVVHCITVLQRKWRNRQWRLYVQPELIQLATDMLMQVSSV